MKSTPDRLRLPVTVPSNDHATSFVRVLARISLVLAALGVVWALAQMLLALLLPDAMVAVVAGHPQIPTAIVWALEHRHGLSLALLLLSLSGLAVAWGLLKRQEWARLAFIALLVGGALVNFAGLPLVDSVFDGILRLYPAELLETADGQQFMAQMRFNRSSAFFTTLAGAVGIAALHGWLAWKLCTAPVRAAFGRSGA